MVCCGLFCRFVFIDGCISFGLVSVVLWVCCVVMNLVRLILLCRWMLCVCWLLMVVLLVILCLFGL